MNALKLSSRFIATMVLSALFTSACEHAGPAAPLAALVGDLAASRERISYQVTGDCSESQRTVMDPGVTTTVADTLILRGAVFDCPLTGDIAGRVRVALNLTLTNVGTPQVEGRVFGKTTLLVSTFFGRNDLSGTFEGPFNASLADLFSGNAKTNRHGTGDFQGVVMHGVAVQTPAVSNIEVESGQFSGNGGP